MSAVDAHGRTAAKRAAMRQHYLDDAVARVRLKGLTLRCQDEITLFKDEPNAARQAHEMCLGEAAGNSGGSGCLCPGHDPVAEVIAS